MVNVPRQKQAWNFLARTSSIQASRSMLTSLVWKPARVHICCANSPIVFSGSRAITFSSMGTPFGWPAAARSSFAFAGLYSFLTTLSS